MNTYMYITERTEKKIDFLILDILNETNSSNYFLVSSKNKLLHMNY